MSDFKKTYLQYFFKYLSAYPRHVASYYAYKDCARLYSRRKIIPIE